MKEMFLRAGSFPLQEYRLVRQSKPLRQGFAKEVHLVEPAFLSPGAVQRHQHESSRGQIAEECVAPPLRGTLRTTFPAAQSVRISSRRSLVPVPRRKSQNFGRHRRQSLAPGARGRRFHRRPRRHPSCRLPSTVGPHRAQISDGKGRNDSRHASQIGRRSGRVSNVSQIRQPEGKRTDATAPARVFSQRAT